MKLIDVSHNNGDIDWTAVKNDRKHNIEGAIIRAGYGKYTKQKDEMFEANYKGAVGAGLHVGAYWYSYAKNVEDAVDEAFTFLECIKGKTFDLPVYLDIEDKSQLSLGKAVCSDITEVFLKTLEHSGYFAGVYSYDSFFADNLRKDIRTKYAVWVARVENAAPQIATEWGIHQYSHKGAVKGITGSTDLDICRNNNYPAIIKAAGLNGYSKK